MIDRSARAPVSFSIARSAIDPQRRLGEAQFGVLHGEQRLVLLDQGVLRLGQDADHGVEVQRPQRRDDRQPADQLGNHAELEDVVAGDLLQQIAQFQLIVADALLGEADGAFAQPAADDVVEPDERAAADEQDVARVHLDVLLLGMLAAALRRNVGDRAFEHFQQGLLHALARHVAGDRDVLAGLADLVDLVDVEHAALGGLDVEVGGVQQLQQQVLDVLADVAGLGQRGGVADGEGHVEDAGQRLGQQRLAGAGRTDQEDVRLVDLDVRGRSVPCISRL